MNNSLNVFGAAPQGQDLQSVTTAMASTRQAQEVQAAMMVAKHFPRNNRESLDRILEACTRPTLAEAATYSYSRGGTEIVGPSIRLAECIAQNWANLDFGFNELERRNGESTVQAYAWDLETNTRRSILFTVKHRRDTKAGSKPLTEDRDIYELVANQAQRRVRACILALIPGDVVDAALKQCDVTLKSANNGVPIQQLTQGMVEAFAEYQITPEMLAGYIGKNLEAFTETDVRKLRKVFNSLKDGIVGSEYFLNRMRDAAPAQEPEQAQEAAPPVAAQKKAARSAKAKATEPDDLPFSMGLDDL